MVGAITNVTMMRSKLPLKCSFDVKKVIGSKQNERGKWAKEEVFFFKKPFGVVFIFFGSGLLMAGYCP